MQGIREFLQTKAGLIVCCVLILIGLGVIVKSVKSNLGESDTVADANTRIMVCSETGKSFKVHLEPGMAFPVKSPYSGKETGYPYEESCNWTADGKPSSETTYLLHNSTLGKKGPLFCPVCHRLVVKDNPFAVAGRTPPPTEAEYAAQKSLHKPGVEEAGQ